MMRIQEYGSEIEDILSGEISIDRLYSKLLQKYLKSKSQSIFLDENEFEFLMNFANPFGPEEYDLNFNLYSLSQKAIASAYQNFLFSTEFDKTHLMLKGLWSLLDQQPNKNTIEFIKFEIYRAQALGYFKENKYSLAIKKLNHIISNSSKFDNIIISSLSDSLVLLTECYSALGRREDALHSARLCVNVAHDRLDKTNKDSNTSTKYFEGILLDSMTSVILSYCSLASELEKSGMGHLSLDWYERAYQTASKFSLNNEILVELQKLIELSRSHVPSSDARSPVLKNKKSIIDSDDQKMKFYKSDSQPPESLRYERGGYPVNISQDINIDTNNIDQNNGANIGPDSFGNRIRPRSALPRLNNFERSGLEYPRIQEDAYYNENGESSIEARNTNSYKPFNNIEPPRPKITSNEPIFSDFDALRPKSALSKLGGAYQNPQTPFQIATIPEIPPSPMSNNFMMNQYMPSNIPYADQYPYIYQMPYTESNSHVDYTMDKNRGQVNDNLTAGTTTQASNILPYHSIILLPKNNENSSVKKPGSSIFSKSKSKSEISNIPINPSPKRTRSPKKNLMTSNSMKQLSKSNTPLPSKKLKKSATESELPVRPPGTATKRNKTPLSKTLNPRGKETITNLGNKNTASAKDLHLNQTMTIQKLLDIDEFGKSKIKQISVAMMPYFKGLRVEARYQAGRLGEKGRWYPGRIISVDFLNGLYEVEFDNGDREKNIFVDYIRIPENLSKIKKSSTPISITTSKKETKDNEKEKDKSNSLPARVLRKQFTEDMHNVVMKILSGVNQRADQRKIERISLKNAMIAKLQALIRGVLVRCRFPKLRAQLIKEQELRQKERELMQIEHLLKQNIEERKKKHEVRFAEIQTGSSLMESSFMTDNNVDPDLILLSDRHPTKDQNLEDTTFDIIEDDLLQELNGEKHIQFQSDNYHDHTLSMNKLDTIEGILAIVQEEQRDIKTMEFLKLQKINERFDELKDALLNRQEELLILQQKKLEDHLDYKMSKAPIPQVSHSIPIEIQEPNPGNVTGLTKPPLPTKNDPMLQSYINLEDSLIKESIEDFGDVQIEDFWNSTSLSEFPTIMRNDNSYHELGQKDSGDNLINLLQVELDKNELLDQQPLESMVRNNEPFSLPTDSQILKAVEDNFLNNDELDELEEMVDRQLPLSSLEDNLPSFELPDVTSNPELLEEIINVDKSVVIHEPETELKLEELEPQPEVIPEELKEQEEPVVIHEPETELKLEELELQPEVNPEELKEKEEPVVIHEPEPELIIEHLPEVNSEDLEEQEEPLVIHEPEPVPQLEVNPEELDETKEIIANNEPESEPKIEVPEPQPKVNPEELEGLEEPVAMDEPKLEPDKEPEELVVINEPESEPQVEGNSEVDLPPPLVDSEIEIDQPNESNQFFLQDEIQHQIHNDSDRMENLSFPGNEKEIQFVRNPTSLPPAPLDDDLNWFLPQNSGKNESIQLKEKSIDDPNSQLINQESLDTDKWNMIHDEDLGITLEGLHDEDQHILLNHQNSKSRLDPSALLDLNAVHLQPIAHILQSNGIEPSIKPTEGIPGLDSVPISERSLISIPSMDPLMESQNITLQKPEESGSLISDGIATLSEKQYDDKPKLDISTLNEKPELNEEEPLRVETARSRKSSSSPTRRRSVRFSPTRNPMSSKSGKSRRRGSLEELMPTPVKHLPEPKHYSTGIAEVDEILKAENLPSEGQGYFAGFTLYFTCNEEGFDALASIPLHEVSLSIDDKTLTPIDTGMINNRQRYLFLVPSFPTLTTPKIKVQIFKKASTTSLFEYELSDIQIDDLFSEQRDKENYLHMDQSISIINCPENFQVNLFLRGSLMPFHEIFLLLIILWHNYLHWTIQSILNHAKLTSFLLNHALELSNLSYFDYEGTDDQDNLHNSLLAFMMKGRKFFLLSIKNIYAIESTIGKYLENWEFDIRKLFIEPIDLTGKSSNSFDFTSTLEPKHFIEITLSSQLQQLTSDIYQTISSYVIDNATPLYEKNIMIIITSQWENIWSKKLVDIFDTFLRSSSLKPLNDLTREQNSEYETLIYRSIVSIFESHISSLMASYDWTDYYDLLTDFYQPDGEINEAENNEIIHEILLKAEVLMYRPAFNNESVENINFKIRNIADLMSMIDNQDQIANLDEFLSRKLPASRASVKSQVFSPVNDELNNAFHDLVDMVDDFIFPLVASDDEHETDDPDDDLDENIEDATSIEESANDSVANAVNKTMSKFGISNK